MRMKYSNKKTVFGMIICATLFAACIPKPFTIAGNSMSPNLNNGDIIFFKLTTREIVHGDIVLMLHPQESYSMIARVIGLPNEEITVSDNEVYIDGQLLDERYIDPKNNLKRLKEGTFKIGMNSYFVMGDNRDNSLDSRYFGPVSKEKVLAIYNSTYERAQK
jgi:signal peptidase I, bacterial type